MIKRLFKVTGLSLLALVIVLLAGLAWVLGTESGLQQSLALAKKVAPGELEWEEANGKLIGPLKVLGLHYSQSDGLDTRVSALDFNWHPSALLGAELAIEQLLIEGVEVRLPEPAVQPEEAPSTSGGLTDISLPLSIKLEDIAINDIALYPANSDEAIEISRVALTGSVDGSEIQLTEFAVSAPQGELTLAGDVATRDDYPMNLRINWQADLDLGSPLEGEGSVSGSLAKLQINHQVTGFAQADIAATVSDVISSPTWDASIQASAETRDTGPVTVDADIAGTTELIQLRSLRARLSDSNGELSASGDITLASLNSDLQGAWQNIVWPLQGAPQFNIAEGRFQFSGTPDEYQMRIDTVVDGETIPAGQWTLQADGSTTELSDFSAQGQTLDGTITISGSAEWEDQPSWDVEVDTRNINPARQWREFPGSIDMQIASQGRMDETGIELNADITQLSGSLREQALSGQGRVRMAGDQVSIDNIELIHGATRLDANGQIDEEIALDFKFASPDLATLLPELTGSISMVGSVAGTAQAPQLTTRANAESVSFAGNRIGALQIELDGSLAEDAISSVTLNAKDISAGGQSISNMTLTGEGSALQHSVALSASTDQGNISTQANGGLVDNTWTGELSALQLDETQAGDWRLREAVKITASAEKADASKLCLDNADKLGSLCVVANWLATGDSTASLSISELSPKLAQAYIPPGFVVDTALNADATAVMGADGNLDAKAAITLDSGALTLNDDSSPIRLDLMPTNIDVSLQGDNATMELSTAFTDFGTIDLSGAIADPAGEGKLSGKLNADFTDLTLISAFAPQVQQIAGTLQSDLSLGGTLESPKIEGELALTDFSAEIPETAMLIEETQFSVKGNPDGTLTLDGQSRSGEGQLSIKGSVDPGTRALNIAIDGENYEVANTALMQAVVSPQLAIAMDNSGMQVEGTVTIPSAYINANGGNEGIKTVSSSSDVVFVTQDGEQVEEQASQLSLDVQINLGDSVEVEAGDFRGRLEGDLRVEQTPELAPRGTGTINVVNGDYVIYGQQLDMERGRILFSGGPVDNPSLDMQVARTVQEYEVVAGAKIQGTVQAPRLELYSEPSMPDASILSFILLGQPPGTGASYTLGKYLTPDLYVSYGIGLFDAINTFNMRYSLTDRLALEAASGIGSSADLIFTIEK